MTVSEAPPVHAPILFCCGATTVTGRVLETSAGAGSAWADEVFASLEEDQRIVAAIAFAPGAPGVAHRVAIEHGSAFDREPGLDVPEHAGTARTHTVVERPTAQEYARNVQVALERIAAGRIEKVVLGRGLDVISDPPLDAGAIIEGLRAARPGRYVFGVPLTAASGASPAPVLIGASPELLVRRSGSIVSSFPLAGSVPRVADPALDQERANALLTSPKDLREHAFVVDAIVGALGSICSEVRVDPAPTLVSTDQLHHLGTRIEATLADDALGVSALHLAQLLQPTPAVGGTPLDAALELIDALEGDRGVLTGAAGWMDASGDGEFAVTIRAGVLDGAHLRLFAGAGIVAGSDPQAEVRETGAKLATMRSAVGL